MHVAKAVNGRDLPGFDIIEVVRDGGPQRWFRRRAAPCPVSAQGIEGFFVGGGDAHNRDAGLIEPSGERRRAVHGL